MPGPALNTRSQRSRALPTPLVDFYLYFKTIAGVIDPVQRYRESDAFGTSASLPFDCIWHNSRTSGRW